MAVYVPNLKLVRYNGETPRKLWEIKARNVPTLNRGDLVLLNEVTAILMVKKHGFEMVDNSKLSFSENFASESEVETTPNTDETVVEAYKLPLASEIINLSDEEVKEACKYVGIATNKKIENLKSLLLPYLPQE